MQPSPRPRPTTASGRPKRRALTVGLVLTITLVAFEALAVSTVMPIVADDLGGKELYGWVFSAFFLGSLIGIAVVGGTDRPRRARPAVRARPRRCSRSACSSAASRRSMPILVGARFIQGLGAGTIPPIAYVAIGRSLPERLRPRMFATLSTAWILPGVIGPALAGLVGETLGWRCVFLGLLPLIAVAGVLTHRAIAAVRVPETSAADEHAGRRRRTPAPAARRCWSALGAGPVHGRADVPASRSRSSRSWSPAWSLGLPALLPPDPARHADGAGRSCPPRSCCAAS